MTKAEYFATLMEILKQLFADDDYMSQETLFELQAFVSDKLLECATTAKEQKTLLKEFPWAFKQTEN